MLAKGTHRIRWLKKTQSLKCRDSVLVSDNHHLKKITVCTIIRVFELNTYSRLCVCVCVDVYSDGEHCGD